MNWTLSLLFFTQQPTAHRLHWLSDDRYWLVQIFTQSTYYKQWPTNVSTKLKPNKKTMTKYTKFVLKIEHDGRY